jgi:tetratricopeptide (TPR) repeat protein
VPAGCALAALRRAASGDPEGASRLDPLNSEYHQTMALIAEQAGREGRPGAYEAALREWHAVERLRPTYPGVGYHLAQIAEDQGRPDEALKQYDRALALAPTWTKPLVAEAQLLERMGQQARALEVYRRLDALSESPLFRYLAVDNDFDPNFAYAWVALADRAPAEKARESTVRAVRYLRQSLEGSRAMEGLWRAAGEWEDKQGSELKQLAETLARHHLAFQDPGPRLRAALLLVDSDQTALARQLFVQPGGGVAGEGFFGLVIDGWSETLASLPLRARGEQQAADSLARSAAADLSRALARGDWVAQLRVGPYGWSEAELQSLRNVAGTK